LIDDFVLQIDNNLLDVRCSSLRHVPNSIKINNVKMALLLIIGFVISLLILKALGAFQSDIQNTVMAI
jgi:hypothetical protein